ncbi:MAG: glycosyltransferase family 4 protein, partial [Thermoplasmata archaeon]|nr:glycosyltransferase family 4 protein [Thermoplasmata archaeon]
MRVFYLASANSIHTRRWVNFFADRGWEVHLFSYVKSTGPLAPGVREHPLFYLGPAENFV